MLILNGWKQIAGLLQITEETAMAWAEKHKLPVKRVGRSVLASNRKIVLWVESDDGKTALAEADIEVEI